MDRRIVALNSMGPWAHARRTHLKVRRQSRTSSAELGAGREDPIAQDTPPQKQSVRSGVALLYGIQYSGGLFRAGVRGPTSTPATAASLQVERRDWCAPKSRLSIAADLGDQRVLSTGVEIDGIRLWPGPGARVQRSCRRNGPYCFALADREELLRSVLGLSHGRERSSHDARSRRCN